MRLPKLVKLQDVITQEWYYQCQETKRQYRRIVGGLAWPFGVVKPGCICLLAESRHKSQETENHHVWLIGEAVSDDVQTLLRYAGLLTDVAYCRDWITPLDDPHFRFVEEYNDERATLRRLPLSFTSPPEVHRRNRDLFRFYDTLVDKRTRRQKSLFFGQGSVIVKDYATLTLDDFRKPIEEFPSVAALLYALAEIDLNPPVIIKNRRYQVPDSVGGY